MNKSATSHRAPTPEGIATRAYEIYEREGRPEGRDLDHWFTAETQLIVERPAPATRREPKPATAMVTPAASRISRAVARLSAPLAR